jgi:hypothetical protein
MYGTVLQVESVMDNCHYHSSKTIAHTCVHCGKGICINCTIIVEGEPFCQVCWERFVSQIQPVLPLDSALTTIPWQHRRELGFLQAFIDTGGMVAFQPARFFKRIPAGTEMSSPLLFAVICILVFWFPMYVFYLKFLLPAFSAGLAVNPEISERIQSLSHFDLLFLPLDYMIYYILFASMLQQLLVSLFHGRKGYAATLQIRCYAMIVQCLWLIPVLGIILSEIVSMVLCTRGFQVAQQLSLPRALLVAAVPAMISVASFMIAF